MGVSLGLVGIVDKGIYNPDETYNKGNFILHEGSTWLALKNNLQGVEPAEGESWKFLARGFAAEILSLITAVDSAGLVGNAGAETDGQTLLDAIADKVANQLLEKKMMSNVQVNDATMVPTSALAYAMQQAITQLNSNFWRTFNTDTLLTTQAEELSNGITFGYIDSYGKVSETGVPLDRSYYVFVKKKNENYIQLTLYDVSTDTIYFRTKSAGTWKDWNANSLKSDLKTKVVSETTTDSGAINTNLDVNTAKILSLKMTSQTGFAFMRGDNYATCFDVGMTLLKNKSVTIEINYIEQ